jgi:hypothetical protein
MLEVRGSNPLISTTPDFVEQVGVFLACFFFERERPAPSKTPTPLTGPSILLNVFLFLRFPRTPELSCQDGPDILMVGEMRPGCQARIFVGQEGDPGGGRQLRVHFCIPDIESLAGHERKLL